jgi:hypothetical protein
MMYLFKMSQFVRVGRTGHVQARKAAYDGEEIPHYGAFQRGATLSSVDCAADVGVEGKDGKVGDYDECSGGREIVGKGVDEEQGYNEIAHAVAPAKT